MLIFSRYTSSCNFKNGGVGWRVGDEVTVTEGGKSFTIRVSKETFEYTYASDGLQHLQLLAMQLLERYK